MAIAIYRLLSPFIDCPVMEAAGDKSHYDTGLSSKKDTTSKEAV
jgi:hypothetical protein